MELTEERGLPLRRSVAMRDSTGKPSRTALRTSLPTDIAITSVYKRVPHNLVRLTSTSEVDEHGVLALVAELE